MGMIDSTTPEVANSAAPAMNPLLQKVEESVKASVPQDQMQDYLKIVSAGMKVAFSEKTHSAVVEGLDDSKDPIHDVAVGTVGLLLTLRKQSGDTMPIPPMVPAGMTLVLHGLDYLERSRGKKITNKEVDTTTELFISTLLPKVGITPEVMKGATDKAQSAMQNEPLMRKFQQQEGGV